MLSLVTYCSMGSVNNESHGVACLIALTLPVMLLHRL